MAAVPLFAVPSMAFGAVVYITIPAALRGGIPLAIAVPTQFALVLGGMAGAAWLCAVRESPGEGAVARLRLRRPGWRDIAVGVGVGAAMLASYLWLSFTGEWMSQWSPLSPPAWLAEFVTRTHLLGIPFGRT